MLTLQEARKAKGWTQAELSAHTRITQATISLIENAHQEPTEKQALILEAVLGADIEWPRLNRFSNDPFTFREKQIFLEGFIHLLNRRGIQAALDTFHGKDNAALRQTLALFMEEEPDPPPTPLDVPRLDDYRRKKP